MSFPKCFFHPWPSILFTACPHFPFYVHLIFLHPYLSPPVTLCCVVAVNGGLPSPPMCSPRFWLAHPSTLKHHLYPFSATYSIKQKKNILGTWFLSHKAGGQSFFQSAGLRFHTCVVQELNLVVVLFLEGIPMAFWRLLGGGLGWEENIVRALGHLSLSAISSFSHFAWHRLITVLLFSALGFLIHSLRKKKKCGLRGGGKLKHLLLAAYFLSLSSQSRTKLNYFFSLLLLLLLLLLCFVQYCSEHRL